MATFEHGIYAWSGHGLEGRSRYQMTAATPQLRQAIVQRHPLASLSAEHSGWTAAADDPSKQLLGWRIDNQGMFVWLKRRLPAEHWAARGGHLVHYFHSTRPASLTRVCSLISAEHLRVAEDRAAVSDQLAPVPRDLQPDPATEDQGILDLAEMLVGIALSRNGRSAAGVATSSDDFISALVVCATNCPLPVFTRRNLSSSERPDRAGGNAIVGMGPTAAGRRRVDVPVLVVQDLPPSTLIAARVAIRNRSISTAAIKEASTGRSFDPKLFEALASFLGGRAEDASDDTIARVLNNPVALDVAADVDGLRSVLAERVAGSFLLLGQRFVDATVDHLAKRAFLSAFVDAICSSAVPSGLLQIAKTNDWFRRRLFFELAQRADLCHAAFSDIEPSEAAQILSFLEPTGGSPTTARRMLIRAIVDRRGGAGALAEVPAIDGAGVLRAWWEAQQFDAFSEAVTSVPWATLDEAARLSAINEDASGLRYWSHLPGTLHRDAMDRFAWAMAKNAPDLSAGFTWALRRVARRYVDDDAARLLVRQLTPSLVASLDPAEQTAASEDVNRFVEGRVQDRLRRRVPLEVTRAELGLLRVISACSLSGRQLFRAAGCAQIMVQDQLGLVGAGWAEARLIDVTDQAQLRPVAAVLFLDGAAASCATPADLAHVVAMTARAAQVPTDELWSTVLDIFETHTKRGIRWSGQAALWHDSLWEAARRGHFGMGRRGIGPPKALTERTAVLLERFGYRPNSLQRGARRHGG